MSDNSITSFLFDGEITVRVIDRNGALWFFAADVCRAIGLTNASNAVSALEDHERSTLTLSEGGPDRHIISESGLHAIVLRSDDAMKVGTPINRFRRWVTAEVLPCLRKGGSYVMTDSASVKISKHWTEWSLEERRLALADVNTVRRTFNQGAAAWRWTELGLPTPPRHLMPAWWQTDLIQATTLPIA